MVQYTVIYFRQNVSVGNVFSDQLSLVRIALVLLVNMKYVRTIEFLILRYLDSTSTKPLVL